MHDIVSLLPHVNALLNALAAVLLLTGYVLIKKRREHAHKWTMLSCFGVSAAFFASYVVYHAMAGSRKFPGDAPASVRTLYYAILLTHVLLAASVPFLASGTIYFGLRDRRVAHRRLAQWTFPIWMYVSVTGIIVYLMLYQIYTPTAAGPIMP